MEKVGGAGEFVLVTCKRVRQQVTIMCKERINFLATLRNSQAMEMNMGN